MNAEDTEHPDETEHPRDDDRNDEIDDSPVPDPDETDPTPSDAPGAD